MYFTAFSPVLCKKKWIAISSIGHKCSSKNKQQVFKQFPQFHVLVTLFTASSMAFQNKSRNEFIEWTEQFIYLFDLCFEWFFLLFFASHRKCFLSPCCYICNCFGYSFPMLDSLLFWKAFDYFNFHFTIYPKIKDRSSWLLLPLHWIKALSVWLF